MGCVGGGNSNRQNTGNQGNNSNENAGNDRPVGSAPNEDNNRQQEEENRRRQEEENRNAAGEPQQGSVSVIPHQNKFSEEEVAQKREVMKHSLQEGHSHPPSVHIPSLGPISTIES